MSAIASARAIVADTLKQWGVTRALLKDKRLDTTAHGGKALLSLDGKSTVAALAARGRGRFALDHVVVRGGHSLELAVPAARGADLVANRLEIEPGGELVVAEGSRFVVGELVAGQGSPNP